MTHFMEVLFIALMLSSTYILIAVGFTLFFGAIDIVQFAHRETAYRQVCIEARPRHEVKGSISTAGYQGRYRSPSCIRRRKIPGCSAATSGHFRLPEQSHCRVRLVKSVGTSAGMNFPDQVFYPLCPIVGGGFVDQKSVMRPLGPLLASPNHRS